MAKKPLPTPEELRQLFDYNPISGVFTHRHRRREMFKTDRGFSTFCSQRAGRPAGSITGDGYVFLCATLGSTKHYMLGHRVAWALHFGDWPANQIDHINGIRTDNRIANLRQATQSQNMCNRAAQSGKSSRFKGVYKGHNGKWCARINLPKPPGLPSGERLFLGYFETEALAAEAYNDAVSIHHGGYARVNNL